MFDKFRSKLSQVANEDDNVKFKDYEEKFNHSYSESHNEPQREEPKSNSSIEGNNIELKVVRPESMEEIFTIADYLINGCTVVLNLEELDKESVTRLLDFLNGVTYTTGGEVKNVSPNTFIITPTGININR